MADETKTPILMPKRKVVRCDKTCVYVSGGNEPKQCKSKRSRELGHILNCKCRTHEMQ